MCHVLIINRLFNTEINFLMKYFLSILDKTIEQINKKTYLHHETIHEWFSVMQSCSPTES